MNSIPDNAPEPTKTFTQTIVGRPRLRPAYRIVPVIVLAGTLAAAIVGLGVRTYQIDREIEARRERIDHLQRENAQALDRLDRIIESRAPNAVTQDAGNYAIDDFKCPKASKGGYCFHGLTKTYNRALETSDGDVIFSTHSGPGVSCDGGRCTLREGSTDFSGMIAADAVRHIRLHFGRHFVGEPTCTVISQDSTESHVGTVVATEDQLVIDALVDHGDLHYMCIGGGPPRIDP